MPSICALPRKNWDDSDAEIQLLAGEIGRTESAVCFKIANLKACDPNRTGLGFTNTAGMDRQVISEYLVDPDATMSEAMWELEQIGIRISYDGEIETSGSSRPDRQQQLGLERVEQVRARQPGLLPQRASFQLRRYLLPHGHRHSRPAHGEPHQAVGGGHAERATHVVERPPAQPLHDRAFDRDLITLDDRYRVVVSSRVSHTPTNDQWLYAFDGRKIALPGSNESTWPSLDFIHYHNDCVFERCT